MSKIIESYEGMFSTRPKKARLCLEAGDHPELDQSDVCNEEEIKQYQTLISQLQWLISLGRFDIAVHTMSLSRFRAQPQTGHLDRVKRIFGYLAYLPEGAIRFRTGEPDFTDIQNQEFGWSRTVYGSPNEIIPTDIPQPRGNHVTTVHYVDANLRHDLVTGRSVTAILHIVNGTTIDWYPRDKQQWKLLHMDQNLLQQGLLLTK